MSYSRNRRPANGSSSNGRSQGGGGARSYRGGRSSTATSGRRGPKKEYIHPSKFIKPAKMVTEEKYVSVHRFSDFAVDSLIHENLRAMKYDQPSPIQDQTIPLGLEGKDIVGIANTGTGKTAAFSIPLLHQLITDHTKFAIIMAPTRELAEQIDDQCRQIASGSRLSGALLIGGVSMGPQLRDLRYNPQLVIGTPGRIKDHIERGSLRPNKFNIAVLDEVDRMLDMGFINDITHILKQTAPVKQSLFFSATLDDKVRTIIDTFSNNPVHVMVKTGDTSDNVEQNIVEYAPHEQKIDKLHDVLIKQGVTKALVFDDTHRSVEKLSKDLLARGFQTDAIHGGKSQAQRQRALKRFKNSEVTVLVATDVAARGIDVSDITHVINFSTPQSYSDYVHRIGRAGRAGRKGYALTFIER